MRQTIKNILTGKRTIDISLPSDKKSFNVNFHEFLKENESYRGRIVKDRIELMKIKMSFDDSLSLEGFNPSRFCSFEGSFKEIEFGRITISGTIEFIQVVVILQYIFFIVGIILLLSQTWKISLIIGLKSFGFLCLLILLLNLQFGLIKMIFRKNFKDIANNNYVA